jgi:hypothetical protein
LIILFNLSSTPEAENHGALAAGIRRRLARERSGARLAALLDETPYRQRLGAQSDAEHRLQTRRAEWERVLARRTCIPGRRPRPSRRGGAGQRLESVLVKEAGLLPRRGTA